MNIKRRDFIKNSAIFVVSLSFVQSVNAQAVQKSVAVDPKPDVEKSIKAHFGGGFEVISHNYIDGLTYADITHAGNRYVVSSNNLHDWTILLSSFGNVNSVCCKPANCQSL